MNGNINNKVNEVKKRLIDIYKRTGLPDKESYLFSVEKANFVLSNESNYIRPYAQDGLPGGLLNLKKDIPTIIVPDLHARVDFFLNIMCYKKNGESVLEMLNSNKLQVVCVGDAFHAEIRAIERWKKAFNEFKNEYEKHKYMDEEMRESLGVMEMVMTIKCAFPDNFHFLKGNHENISNENREGNYPFRKFTYEGQMVLEYVLMFYGKAFLKAYYNLEKNIPLFAVGRNFLISHAEPLEFYEKEEIINYRKNSELIRGFTWTDNDQAEEGSVNKMLASYLPEEYSYSSYYFGGHRPIMNYFNQRAGGRYVQIHNPSKFIIAYIKVEGNIELERDVFEIKDRTLEILKEYY